MGTVTSAAGASIAFDVSGEGAPVVLVGPAFADHSASAPLAAQPARHLRVFN